MSKRALLTAAERSHLVLHVVMSLGSQFTCQARAVAACWAHFWSGEGVALALSSILKGPGLGVVWDPCSWEERNPRR